MRFSRSKNEAFSFIESSESRNACFNCNPPPSTILRSTFTMRSFLRVWMTDHRDRLARRWSYEILGEFKFVSDDQGKSIRESSDWKCLERGTGCVLVAPSAYVCRRPEPKPDVDDDRRPRWVSSPRTIGSRLPEAPPARVHLLFNR